MSGFCCAGRAPKRRRDGIQDSCPRSAWPRLGGERRWGRMLDEHRRGGALLVLVLVAIVILGGVTSAALSVFQTTNTFIKYELNYHGQAVNAAKAGLVDALAWFRRQTSQPVNAFAPALDMDADPAINETADPEIGLVREYQISTRENIWGRYEVRLRAVRDVTGERNLTGTGRYWYIESRGYVFERLVPEYTPRDFYAVYEFADGTQRRKLEDGSYAVEDTDPDDVLTERHDMNMVRLMASETMWTEVRRLSVVPPADATICLARGDLAYLGNRSRVNGGEGYGLVYPSGTGDPTVESGAELSGTPAKGAADPATYLLDVADVFGVTPEELRSLSDIYTDDPSTLPATLPDYQLVYIDGDATWTASRPLRGTAIVYVAGDATLASQSSSYFSGILYVEGDAEHGGDLVRALAAQGLDVKMRGVETLPLALGEIVVNDVLVLSNVPASMLGEEGMRAVELAVKDWGVGLVMIGGEDSYGPGGYQDSPVERALPVSMDIKQRRVMPSGALVIILHTCEIPQGNYWAQEIAKAALRVLGPSDEYGVLYFDWQGGVQWLFELQRVENKARMARLISGVQPGDMPDFIPSFKEAHEALAKSTASIKHVVVISDGDPQYPSDNQVVSMVADGITISAVGISPHSQFDTNRLQYIASIGRGRYYEPTSSSALPQIFIKEAATVRRSLIFEETFTPRVADVSELLKGIDPDEYPALRGYVLTTGRELAEIPLVSHHDDPVLAHWQYGLGRTVAFTSDAKARWAAAWLSWDKYAQFWAQVVRWCSRNVDAAGVTARTDIVDDRGRIVIDAIDRDGRFVNDIRFTSVLITPDNEEVGLDVEQTGPGRYEASFEAGRPGTHYLSLSYRDKEGKSALYTQGITVPYSTEYRELSANVPRLEALAKTTGGRMLLPEDDVFARTFDPVARLEAAWPLLLLLAILLVPADVFVRRVFVDYRAVWGKVALALSWMPIIGAPARRRLATQATHVGALLVRKRATREELAQRAKKFESTGDVRPAEPGLSAEGEEPRERVTPIKPAEVDTTGPTIVKAEETFMGRLLKAKREAQKDLDGSKDEDGTAG